MNSISHKARTALRLIKEHSYYYSDKKYPDSFMSKYTSALPKNVQQKNLDKVVYTFWTGDNEMSDNRKRCLLSLQSKLGVKVVLVTPSNLDQYILQSDPLPDAFQYLSCNHKSDYLRAYFMHYYGGGYSDIKEISTSWEGSFEMLEREKAFVIGYPELSADCVATPNDSETYNDLKFYWRKLIGNGAFICRAQTRFTEEWYRESKRRLLDNSKDLMTHPALDPFGTNSDYPIKWTYMMGDIFHPLCLKYHKKILHDERIMPIFENYR